MSQHFKVLFCLKKGRNRNPNSLPIHVRVTTNGERAEWTCQRSCDPSKWSQQNGRAIGNKYDVKSLNQYLDAIQSNIFGIQKEYTLRNEPITATQVREKVLHQTEAKQHTLIEIYQHHNDQFEKLVGAEFSYGTYKKFKSALKSLKEFLQWKFKKKDIHLQEVNQKFITDYEFYLKTIRHLQHNSAMVNIKKLKK